MNRLWRILVVNDGAPIARVLRRGVAARGYEAPVASEGEEALEIFNS
jgi:ActR/RegA family two-component response regulator